MAGALLLLGFFGDGILRLVGARYVLSRRVWGFAAVWLGGGIGLLIFQIPGLRLSWGTLGLVIFVSGLQWWVRREKVDAGREDNGIADADDLALQAGLSKGHTALHTLRGIIWWFLVGLATVWVALISAQAALVSPVEGVTGLGNWLFKAKVILTNGAMPRDFFAWAGENRHIGYPPGLPSLCAWLGWCMGGLDLLVIRVLPWLAWFGAFFLLASLCARSLRGLGAVIGLAVLFTSTFGQLTLRYFFAEPLLMFGIAVVLAVLHSVHQAGRGWLAFFLVLGPLAWIKQEGAVIAALLAGFLWLQAGGFGIKRRVVFLGCLGGVLLWVLPWRLALWESGVQDENFSAARLFDAGAWERMKLAAEFYFSYAWTQGENFAGAWWLFPVALGIAILKKNRLSLAVLGTSVVYVAVVILMMAGNVQEDFQWHLMAAVRVLLLPSALVILVFGIEFKEQKKDKHNILTQ